MTAQGAFLGANGFTTVAGGNITLISDGALNFNTAGLPGTIGTLRLSAGGDVTQSAGAAGAISASTLVVVTSSGKIDLENAANSFSTLAAQDTDTGAIIVLDSITTPLTIGAVAADADGCVGAVTGVVSNTGDITLATAGAP